MIRFPNLFPRKIDAAQMLLFGLVALTGTVDMSRGFGTANLSAMGAAQILACGAAWAIWLMKPYLPNDIMKAMLPLVLFEGYALGSMLWYSPGSKGLQLLSVGLAFLGVILVTARETDKDPGMAQRLHAAMLMGSAVAVTLYLIVVAQVGIQCDGIVNARPFALYSMIAIGVAVAHWRSGHFLALVWAVIILMVVFLSLSRTALVACLLLFPLGVAIRGNKKSLLLAVLILALGAAAFATALFTYKPLYDRFFAFDASMKVAGMSVNASGRTLMWAYLKDDIRGDWVFGKGIGASADLIDRYFPLLGHPHNDFLRWYYDLGIVGLSMWLAFFGMFIAHTAKNLARSIKYQTADYPMHIAPLLGMAGVAFAMGTDNPVSYTFVMMPWAILIGCSLGTGRAVRRNVELMYEPIEEVQDFPGLMPGV